MSRVLVDSSALLTLLDGDDPRQEATRAAFADRRDDELVTHGYVVAESLAVARRRFGPAATASLIDDLLPSISVIAIDTTLHAEALRAYRASLPSGTSFVDQVSLALIEREGITTVLALDPDLARGGATVVPGP